MLQQSDKYFILGIKQILFVARGNNIPLGIHRSVEKIINPVCIPLLGDAIKRTHQLYNTLTF